MFAVGAELGLSVFFGGRLGVGARGFVSSILHLSIPFLLFFFSFWVMA